MRTLGTGVALLGVWLVSSSHPDSHDAAPGALRGPALEDGQASTHVAAVGSAVHLDWPGVELVDTRWVPPSNALAVAYELNDVVQQYCVRCHNERRLRGNLSLESFDVTAAQEQAATAEKMIVKLRAGMMPPPEARRPAGDTLLTLVETLETVIDEASAGSREPGQRRFQRLNRAEYERQVHDLLALEVDAGQWLPADTYLGNFDNMSAAQGLSTTLLESYLRAATEVSRIAVGNPNAVSTSTKYTSPIETSQHAWDHIDGAPYGTRGGIVVAHDFPADGHYTFQIETLFGQGTSFEDVDIAIDGEGVALLALENNGIDVLHRCGGYAGCTTCRVEFAEGEPSRMTRAEKDKLADRELTGVRLSCQIPCQRFRRSFVLRSIL